jgi:drug/metabolite transporter (DMT)-like permease
VSVSRLTRLDLLLALVIIAWGANLSVIKVALREFPAASFNALRLILAAAAFAAVLTRRPAGEARVIGRADWPRVVWLGVVGGALYQLLFLAGVPRTSVANAGLIFGISPVVISMMSAAVGHEHLPWTRWAGGVLSVVGLYFVVGVGASLSVNSFTGDALVFLGMLCWALYSVGSRPILGRYSPTVLTAWTTIIGAAIYVAVAVPTLRATRWEQVSWASWSLMAASSLVCLVLAYVIWHTGVQRMGATRTAAYSNLTPIAAIVVGRLWLGEPITAAQVVGAAAILGGVFLTRLSPVVLTPLRDV